MTRKISMVVIMLIAFVALLQCNVFAAETLPEADANGVITLIEDVELTQHININESVTIDLNGHNITRSSEIANHVAIFVNNPDVVLTITGNGTVSAYGPAIWVNAGKVNLNGGNYTSTCNTNDSISPLYIATSDAVLTMSGNGTVSAYGPAVFVTNGKAILNSGNYTSTGSSTIYAYENGYVEVKGGTYKNDAMKNDPSCYVLNLNDSHREKAKIVVTGGIFENWDPSNNGAEGAGTNFLAEGYKSVKDGENYKVIEDDDYNFQKALDAGGTVKLTKNLVLTKPAVVTKTVTLDLNGKTIKNETGIWSTAKEEYSLISVKQGGDLTINGNGKIEALTDDCYTIEVVHGGKLTINGGEYIGNCSAIYIRTEGTVVINDGVFSIKQLATSGNGYGETVNCRDQYYKEGTAKVEITGGKYYKYDPSNAAEPNKPQTYVVAGYTAYGPDSDGYYKVCKHNLAKTDAKAATYTADGNIEYYTCDVCKNMFKDATGKQLTNKIEVTIPMLIQVNGGNASVGDVVVDEAIKDSGNSSVVELPTVGNATSVTVPVESVKAVDEANKGLTVETKDTTVTLDAKAVEEVAKQAGNATEITIEVTKTEEKILNKEQKEAIKDKEVAIVLSAKILADGKEISNFNGGKVKVEIPFTPAEGTKGSDYKVYYVADDGKVTAIPTRYVKGNLVVELEHFSEYVVVKEVANAGAPAPAAPAANPNEKDNTPKTGAISVIGLVVAMSVIGLAVLRRKD